MSIEEKLKLINNKKAIYSNKNIKQDQNDYLYPGIYLYIFPDDKKYVGQTKINILYRLSQHIHDAINNNNHGCPLLDNKIRNLIKTVTNKIPDNFEEWEKIFFNKLKIKILEKIEQGNLNEIEFQKLLDAKEGYYIDKYKCYKNSLNYDGKLGLNCKPGVLTTEIHKRDINNCYDHNENLLKNGIESIKIKNKIVGYKARIRGKYDYSITMGNSYNYTLDKKLEIVNEFKKIKINSVELEKKVINEFKKKYNINNFHQNQRKSYNKIDHNNVQLPSYIFFDKINKKYKLYICREGVSKTIDFYELVDLDLQLEKAKYFRNLYINLKLDDKSIMNMTYNDLKSHIKKNNLPIMTVNRNRERLPFCILIEKLIKYENNETREQIENEHNLEKKWIQAHDFPDGWKQLWGSFNKDNKWINTGHFMFKNPDNILFSHESIAKKYINIPLPNFNEIIKKFPKKLKYNNFQSEISKYIYQDKDNIKGWKPYISDAWISYKNNLKIL